MKQCILYTIHKTTYNDGTFFDWSIIHLLFVQLEIQIMSIYLIMYAYFIYSYCRKSRLKIK